MDTTTLLTRMTGALAIVVGLLFLLLYLLKRVNRIRAGAGEENVTVVSVQPIMHRKYLALVRVRERMLLLGVTDNSITLLESMEAESGKAVADGSASDSAKTFRELLEQTSGRENENGSSGAL